MPKNLGLYNNTLSVPRKKDIDAVQDTVDMHDSDIQQLETDVSGLNTEVGAVKTALTSKQDAITGAASTVVDDNLTASKVIISNASGKIATSDVTTTQLNYLKNPVTSVNGKTGAVVIDAGGIKIITQPKRPTEQNPGDFWYQVSQEYTFSEIDKLNYTFADIDNLNITWEEVDKGGW